jgi:hypothetical protein
LPQSLCQKNAAGADADEDHIIQPFVFFQDFISDPRERTIDACRIHDNTILLVHSAPPVLQAQKKAFPFAGRLFRQDLSTLLTTIFIGSSPFPHFSSQGMALVSAVSYMT